MPDPHGLQPLLDKVLAAKDRAKHPAWGELAGRLRLLVKAFVLSRVWREDDASNFAQDVMLKAHCGLAEFHGSNVPALIAWVKKIAWRVVVDGGGKVLKHPPLGPLPGGIADPPPPSAVDPELIDAVLRGVARLPPTPRRIVTAFYLEGRSCEEIGRGLTPRRTANCVAVNKLRAVRALRELLGGQP